MRSSAALLLAGAIALALACTPGGDYMATPTPRATPTPSLAAILTEAQAIDAAVRLLLGPAPEITGVDDPREPVARLMTLGEYESRYTSGRSVGDRDLQVWVVQVRGESHTAGIAPEASRQTYQYAVAVLDAATGQRLMTSHTLAPVLTDGADPTPAPVK